MVSKSASAPHHAVNGGLSRVQEESIKELMRTEFKLRDELGAERNGRLKDSVDSLDRRLIDGLASAKDAVGIAFSAAKEAGAKSEAAQHAHDDRSNGLQQKLDIQAREFVRKEDMTTRDEAMNQILDTHRQDIVALRLVGAGTSGKEDALAVARTTHRWVIGIGIPLLMSVLGLLVMMLRKP